MEFLTSDLPLKPYSKCIIGVFEHKEESDRRLESAYIYVEIWSWIRMSKLCGSVS